MALPTMPHYWTTRRNIYENAIVKQRNHDDHFRQRWGTTANYFNKSNIAANKKKEWESDESLRNSMDKYNKEKDKNRKAENLARRRRKLGELLKEERLEYEAELKGYSKANFERLEDMKDRADTLRSAREEKRKKLAEEKLYEHWRQNNPDLRKIESEQLQDHVIDKWSVQLEESRQRVEEEKKEREKYEQEMELERKAALQLQHQQEEERLQEEKQLKNVLKEQMMELKAREAEAERLKKEQDALQREQWRLEDLEDQRKEMEKNRQQRAVGRMLLRQHKTQLMRRSRQIQEELENDKKILEGLLEREEEERELQTARREKAKADAAWMKQVIEDQIQLEKAREAELDMLYQDEAARMWQKRDAEWERERKARERLMNEVLDDRQRQIEEKMEEIRIEREESIKQREQLIAEMEIANQMTHREQEEAKAQREAFKLDLKGQITARQEREIEAVKRMEDEKFQEEKEEKDYDEFLKQETERMRLQSFTPRHHGRKTAWM